MSDFAQRQREFAQYIRNPDEKPSSLDGIEQRRLAVYQQLIFNNLMNFTSSALPVAYSIMGDDWWCSAVRQFLIQHRCSSPYFNEIAGEFIGYLREQPSVVADGPDFLMELMHYEWVELALDNITEDTEQRRQQLGSDLVDGKPVVSSAAWLLSYEYPVHKISTDYQPTVEQKQATILLVFRKPDLTIGFRLLAPVFALLWQQLLDTDTRSGQQAIDNVAKQLNVPGDENFQRHASNALHELYDWGALLGAD